MPRQSLRILLCGDFDDAEMQPAATALAAANNAFELRRIPDLGRIASPGMLGGNEDDPWVPDLIVVAQLRPEQYWQADVRHLQARFPLARCICCYGAWCESDGRNSTLWPDAVRVSARSATARIRREIGVLEGRLAPLPLTASRDEIFEFDSPGDWNAEEELGTVRVISEDTEFRRSIEALAASFGFTIELNSHVQNTSVLVWDIDPWNESVAAQIRKFRNEQPEMPIVALMNFGHPQAVSHVMECGADAIVPKLAPAEILLETLRVAMAEHA